MRPNHVHLHVRDLDVSTEFYRRWFPLEPGPEYGEGLRFMKGERGFDLALSVDDDPEPLPRWFHWGFKAASRGEVRKAYQEMVAAGVAMRRDLLEDDHMVSFRCADPDGHCIEIYWEVEPPVE